MAGAARLDLWSSQEDVSAPEGGTCHAPDALWHAGSAAHRADATRVVWALEHRVCRAGESDQPPQRGGARSPDLVDRAGGAAPPRPAGVVARVLPRCATPRVLAAAL